MIPKVNVYQIDTPYRDWKGFGLARKNMGLEGTIINCPHKDEKGNLMYPGNYYVDTLDMLLRPRQLLHGTTYVYLCAFADARRL